MYGVESVDSTATSYECPPKLTLNGVETSLAGSVTYQGSITPVLTTIAPRFGKVEGGEPVTFTGTGF